MKNIKDYTLQELKEELKILNEKPFRAEQIFSWLYKEKVKSFEEMTNLSLELREKLSKSYTICNFNILKKQESTDGTKKYLFDVLDGNAIETVLMQYHHGKTICVSSQIGCKMGCKFCASTGIKFERSLTPGEIVEQIIAVEQDIQDKISNIVFMGIGEPFDNYDNVIKAIRILNDPKGLNIGARHISISTSGLVPKIYDLANYNISLSKKDWDSFETSWDFEVHPFIKWSKSLRDSTAIATTISQFYCKHIEVNSPLELCGKENVTIDLKK